MSHKLKFIINLSTERSIHSLFGTPFYYSCSLIRGFAIFIRIFSFKWIKHGPDIHKVKPCMIKQFSPIKSRENFTICKDSDITDTNWECPLLYCDLLPIIKWWLFVTIHLFLSQGNVKHWSLGWDLEAPQTKRAHSCSLSQPRSQVCTAWTHRYIQNSN